MIEHYPEILRVTYDEIVDALNESELSLSTDQGRDGEGVAADLSLQVVEWIRINWGGRTLTRLWFQFPVSGKTASNIEIDGELFQVASDPVKSIKGRELRAATMQILFQNSTVIVHPCFTASLIATTVETCLSLSAVYIPKGKEIDRLQRDQDIWRKFHWLGNIDQVIAKHGLAQSQIYTIKRRIQKERDLREQPNLF